LATLSQCKNKKQKKTVQKDTSINQKNSFNELFLDSIQLNDFLAANKDFTAFSEQFNDFYESRNYEYAWFDSAGLTQHAHSFINLLQTTVADLQDSSLFSKNFLTIQDSLLNKKSGSNKKETLSEELILTGQFFLFTTKVYKGSDINAAELGWFIPRKKVDLKELLKSTLQSDSANTEQYAPLNSQYKKLQKSVAFYHTLAKNQPWDSLPYPVKSFKRGDSSLQIIQLKKRLQLLGDAISKDTTKYFDSSFLIAVKSFQQRMGLESDGVIGKQMIEQLNITPSKRIEQILVNLERMRWMPAQKNDTYILVNIPEYKMHVYDSGKLQFDMNVIVGTSTNSTVIFSGNLKYIVFSPYWNVPESIVQKEIIPGMKRNSNYLKNKNMEITGYSNGLPNVRQKPGADNSLGLVKFLFPNSHSIYLHDTPNRNLFQESTRSFSHGCIRIAEPKKMAQYLLRSDTAKTWTSIVIDSAMHSSKEKWVTVKNPLPVLIAYFTAWVDVNGKLNFRKDIYKHDEKLAAKLFTK
jgi:murein L,D-transpeptidase YcbB/YkuD